MNQTVSMFENIVEYCRKSDGMTIKKILSCIFSKKIVLEKGKVATCEFITPVQVLFNVSKVFDGFNIKKEVKNDLLSCLAPLTAQSCNYFIPFQFYNALSF
jgi:hypothetical protein